MPPTPPAIFIRATLVLSAITLLTAIAGLIGSVLGEAYFLAGFEVIVIAACAMGVLTGLGKFRDGPAIAIACVAGPIFVGALLGYISLGGPILGVRPLYFLGFRALIAMLLFGCAGGVLLARKPGVSFRLLALGVALGAPVLVSFAVWLKVPSMRAAVESMNPTLLALLVTPAALLGIGLVSASVHCVLRAFETGIETEVSSESPQGA